MTLRILYRGALESCNYGCTYCPFAKKIDEKTTLQRDRNELSQFVHWVSQQQRPIGIFFTPWGEALTRKHYREAMIALSHMEHIERVAVQTNLSCKLDWTKQANHSKIAFWATYHPEWTSADDFAQKVRFLHEQHIRVSVGSVGFSQFKDAIVHMRRLLPKSVYLWINAVKGREYAQDIPHDVHQVFTEIDEYYPMNRQAYESFGKACFAGETVFSVNGDGTMFRCHFIKNPIGNIYKDDLNSVLHPRTCTNATCGCHIGYVHMPSLELDKVYGDGILERIPINRQYRLPIL